MKKHVLAFCATLALFAFSYNDNNRQVSGKVLETHDYCGGARLAPDELAETQKPKALAGKKCYVRKGNKNSIKEPVVATFISDSSGNFMIHLPPGEYCIVDSRKYDKNYVAEIAKDHKKAANNYSAADLNCLKAWLTTPDAVFTVKETGENKIEVIYHVPCSWNKTPCVNYSGPTPP